jgi:hypothetical protein
VGVGAAVVACAVWLGEAALVTEVTIWLGMGREPVGCSVSIARTVLLVARSSSTEDSGGPFRLPSDVSLIEEWLVSIRTFFMTLVAEAGGVVVDAA